MPLDVAEKKIFALDQLNNLFIHQWRIRTVIRTLFSLVPYLTIKSNSKKLAKLSRHVKISNIRQLSPIPFVIQLNKCSCEGCPWRMHAAKIGDTKEGAFEVRTIGEPHNCRGIQKL